MAPEVTESLVPGCEIADQCNACQTDRFYMKIWLFNTPEFNAVTVFLSCPVALAVSLWGMTSSKIQQTLGATLKRGGSISSALLPPSALALAASDSEASDASPPTTPGKASGGGSWGARRI